MRRFIIALLSGCIGSVLSQIKRGIEPRPQSSSVKVEVGAREVAFFVVFVAPVGKSASEHDECLGFLHRAGDVAFGADGEGGEVANCDFDSDSADIGEFRFESGLALLGVGHAQRIRIA